MADFDWKGAIGTIAPKLAGCFGTPVAGVAVDCLCRAFGLEPSAQAAEQIAEKAAAGQLTGAELIQLKKAEADAQAQLLKLNLDFSLAEDKLVAADRDSARNREIQVKDMTPRIIAYGVVLIWAAINFSLLWMAWHHNTVEGGMQATVASIMKTIDMALTFILGYYYGQSHVDRAGQPLPLGGMS